MWILVVLLLLGLMVAVVRESRAFFYRDLRFWVSLTFLCALLSLQQIW